MALVALPPISRKARVQQPEQHPTRACVLDRNRRHHMALATALNLDIEDLMRMGKEDEQRRLAAAAKEVA
jgi:hypothetical protein